MNIGGRGVLEESQDYSLKLKIKSIFSFFLNVFTLRYFQPKDDEPRAHKSSLIPHVRLSFRVGSYQEENQNFYLDNGSHKNSPLERGRTRSGWGVLEESQSYNLKSNKIVSRETIQKALLYLKYISICVIILICIILCNNYISMSNQIKISGTIQLVYLDILLT